MEINLEIYLIGDSNSGKTSILYRYVENYFKTNIYQSISIEKLNKILKRDKFIINLIIKTIPGLERFRNLFLHETMISDGFIFVFDMTNKDSFQEMIDLMLEIENYNPNYKSIICANKCDLKEDRKIFIENLEIFDFFNEMDYIEISAKTGESIEEAFEMIISKILYNLSDDDIYKRFGIGEIKKDDKNNNDNNNKNNKNNGLSKFIEINKYIDF